MEQAPLRAVRFGTFDVNLRAGELRRDGTKIPLQEKPFQFLALLLSRAGEVVSRKELAERLWPPGTHVDFEAGLNTAAKKLRDALGDSAEHPAFIETVGRRGYRFIAPILDESASDVPRARAFPPTSIVIGTVMLIAVIVILVGALAIRKRRPPSARPPIQSLVVLPIISSEGQSDDEYFVDGLTDQLIASLGRVPSLRVMSRESSMQYKKSDVSPRKVAADLDVDAVVIGRLSRSPHRMQVNLQIVDARTSTRAWAHTYESSIDDVFELQERMTADILHYVGVIPRTQFRAAERPNSRAYLLYMRGRYEWNRVPPNYAEATRFFQQAIDEDGRLAVAYAGLAGCYATRRFWGVGIHTPRGDDIHQAKALARRSLQMDGGIGEAYATLGSVADDEYDFGAAEAAFPMAIKLAPSLAYAHDWYALHLSRLGRFDEALAQANIGLKLDPQSWFSITILANVLALAGRNSEAIEAFATQARLYPHARGHLAVFFLNHRLAADEAAVEELSKAYARDGDENTAIRKAYAHGGFAGAVRAAIHEIETKDPEPPQWTIARLSAVVVDSEATVKALQRSYRLGETDFGYVNVCPELAFVKSDPRVVAMMRAIKLRP